MLLKSTDSILSDKRFGGYRGLHLGREKEKGSETLSHSLIDLERGTRHSDKHLNHPVPQSKFG